MGSAAGDSKISIVIPAYNVGAYIGETIQSALDQTLGDFELIVVDDGSTDETAEVAAGFSDPRIRLIRQTNQGSSAARNRGLEACSGRYVCFLDGDDLWVRDKLELQAGWLDTHPETDLIFGASQVVEADGGDAGRSVFRHPGAHSFESMMREDVIGNGSSQMARRDVVERAGRFDVTLNASVDHDLWLRIALLREGNVHGMGRTVTLYRRRGQQISSDWQRKEASWTRLMKKLERIAPERTAKVKRAALANLDRVLSSIAYENGEHREAVRLFARALKRGSLEIWADKRTVLQGLALLSARVLSPETHARLDAAARRLRARSQGAAAEGTSSS